MTVLTIPDMALVVLVGVVRLRQVDVRPHALRADAGAVERRLPRAWSPTTRTTSRPPGRRSRRCTSWRASGWRPGRVTVVDATNVQRESRAPLVALAREHDVLPVAIVLDLPEAVCRERNDARPDRELRAARDPPPARRAAPLAARPGQGGLPPGARAAHAGGGRGRADRGRAAAQRPARRDRPVRRDRRRPRLPRASWRHCSASSGTTLTRDAGGRPVGARHPEGRRAVFVGDLVDRGPDTPGVLRLVMGMVAAGDAICVCGNHEQKLVRALSGRNVQVTPRARRVAGPARRRAGGVPQGGAGLLRRAGGALRPRRRAARRRARRAAGALPRPRVRAGCAASRSTATPPARPTSTGSRCATRGPNDYRGSAMVLYGHTPTPDAEWVNGTMCLDTGVRVRRASSPRCATRSARSWPCRPSAPGTSRCARSCPRHAGAPARREPDVLDIGDVTGKRQVEHRPPRHDHGARRAGRRRAGGDEPVRGRPAVARVPAADHGPDGHLGARGRAGAPGRGVRGVPHRGRAGASCARRSTWARARWCS